MNGLVGGRLLLGRLGPGLPAPTLKPGRDTVVWR